MGPSGWRRDGGASGARRACVTGRDAFADRGRALIVEAARARGVEAGSPADEQLAEWLTSRPSEQLFDRTLRAIRAFLAARPAMEREASRRELLSYSTAIASASGGVLGF